MEAWYGIAGAGAVYHTLNPRLFPDQIAWIANHGGARMLMFDNCFAPIAGADRAQAEACRIYVALTAKADLPQLKLPGKLIAYEELIDRQGRATGPRSMRMTPAGFATLPAPPAIPRACSIPIAPMCCMRCWRGKARDWAWARCDVMLPVVPMFHANGWGIPFTAPMAGASLVMPGPKLDGASLYELLESEKVTMHGRRAHGLAGPAAISGRQQAYALITSSAC